MNKMLKLSAITSIAVLGLALLAAHAQRWKTGPRVINPPGSPSNLPFSNGLEVNGMLFVAGTQGQNAQGKVVPGGIEAETRQALENIRKIVQGAGMDMGNVVAVNVYLADANEFGKMNSVYKTFFPDPKPTRTTVQVARLVNDARIEISAIAVRSNGVRPRTIGQ